MSLPSWLHWLTGGHQHHRRGRPRRSRPAARRRPRLALEQLEDRALLSTYTAANLPDLIADVNAANAAGGPNTITLVAGTTFTLSAGNNSTDGATGLPVIAANDNLTIAGNGDTIARSTATGTPAFRLLDVAAGGSLALANLTLQGGLAFGGGVTAEGGAIFNQGTLLLSGVTMQNNSAQGSAGDYYSTGQSAAGGGIYSSGALTLQGCTIQNNQALGGRGGNVPAGGDALGGGVCMAGGTASLSNVTLQDNQALGGIGGVDVNTGDGGWGGSAAGGGVYMAGGTASLSNVTLYSNTAQGGAGGDGIYIHDLNGTTGTAGGNGGGGFGGGLFVGSGTASVHGTTVNHNAALAGSGGKGRKGASNGEAGLGEGGGLYIDLAASVCLDAFTQAHVKGNQASTAYSNIDGSYTTCP